MRCRLNNRRNGHNGGTNVQQGLDTNSSLSTTVANSTISGSILGPCSTHCHSSSLLDPSASASRSNHHCGCGCLIANYPLSLQHYSQPHHQHHSYQFPHPQYSSRPYRNMGNSIHPVIERPDTCAWDSCDER